MSLEEIHGPVFLEVPSDPASLFLVRCLTDRLTQRLGFPQSEVDRVVLAVDEACANIIRHAYGGRLGERIHLTYLVGEERLEIRIRDFGSGTDPVHFKPRELADVRPGGLGIHFIRSAMDRVEYETPPDGGTLLTMIKLRQPKEGGKE
ncbi:MAG TPA: ATP-binding protein [Syntrophobacteraceae bacterium]|nr:ATP-binding protein [Syntrophobacteraceae bacterium]